MCLHLSVILFTGGGLCPSMHHRSHDQRGVSGESLSRGVSVQGGLCPGFLCPGGLCPGGSLSRGSLSRRSLSRGVSVQGRSVSY